MNLCILFILFFKLSLNRAETELKCNTSIKKTIYLWHLSYTDSWCLVPFSINISCDCVSVLSTKIRNRVIYESQHDVVLYSEVQNGVHSKKILLQSSLTYVEVPVTPVLGRVH
jgi:hypothetical protein